jgi:hypothetical protein
MEHVVPKIYEKPDCYEYTGASSVKLRWPKVDQPDAREGGRCADIIASIKASDPDATIVPFVPDTVDMERLKNNLIDGDLYDKVEAAVASWPSRQRVLWHNGKSASGDNPLMESIRTAAGITPEAMRDILTASEQVNDG